MKCIALSFAFPHGLHSHSHSLLDFRLAKFSRVLKISSKPETFGLFNFRRDLISQKRRFKAAKESAQLKIVTFANCVFAFVIFFLMIFFLSCQGPPSFSWRLCVSFRASSWRHCWAFLSRSRADTMEVRARGGLSWFYFDNYLSNFVIVSGSPVRGRMLKNKCTTSRESANAFPSGRNLIRLPFFVEIFSSP